ncbi:hypothetical protein [Amaricoccus sp.]|uniref:hypothetical protein n=1 Tax=Amaricoccus sp. TaxID=1872485 RepID=UPI0025C252D6|nr:hypothetical protein [Amaricoccus sp.]
MTFGHPFRLAGLDEVLPAGAYPVEAELGSPAGVDPEAWRASVLIHLHRTVAAPGLARTLTIPLSELDRALAEDRDIRMTLSERLLEEMLADPMIRLVMASDQISEDEMRAVWGASRG